MSLEDLQKKMKESITQNDSTIIINDLSSTSEQFSIYAKAYKIRLNESLQEDFNETKEILGDEVFDQIVSDFIATAPSRQEDLAELSEIFPQYLKKAETTKNNLKAIETAEVEWLKVKSYRCSYPGILPEITTEKPLILSPGVYFHQQKLIYTFNNETHVVPVTVEQQTMLFQLQEPQPIEQLVEDQENLKPEELAIWFEFWTKNQIITNYELESRRLPK